MITAKEMELINKLLPYVSPDKIPLTFYYGNEQIRGIPAAFNPKVRLLRPDASMDMYIIEGTDAKGLTLRAEYMEYRDFPVTEWVAYFTNNGTENTPVISDIRIIDGFFTGENPVFVHGNGDNCQPSGYEMYSEALTGPVTTHPYDHSGTPCCGASPYMNLIFDSYGIKIGVGWPAQWSATAAPAEGGAALTIGQQRCAFCIRPGETMRTPRVNLLGYTGGENQGINMWRKWYIKHILPRENGEPVPPKLCLHVFAEGGPEFTGATEEQQVGGIVKYTERGLTPDIWWIDAGWYTCNLDWPFTGTWEHDKERFPNGLKPIGEKCEEAGAKLLLWFEPERVHEGTWLADEHPEWILYRSGENPKQHTGLLNLSLREVQDWLIAHVDGLIKEYHIGIYRQDFNYDPMPNWIANEGEGRIGALENLHVQGYLRYWDSLQRLNRGLYMDSCASGGRRNDLETMRRAVTLQYTDVGLGVHPIKQKQHRYMFEWMPYFRAHNYNWCDAEGVYDRGDFPPDRYSYHVAFAPAVTNVVNRNAPEKELALAREMTPIWRRAAKLMLSGDYYPLSECRRSPEDWYAMQFEDENAGEGFIQAIRNSQCKEESYTMKPKADKGTVYSFFNPETGESFRKSGEELSGGFTVSLSRQSGAVWFYTKHIGTDM